MVNIDRNVHEDIQHLDSRHVDWNKTTVPVVHHEICAKSDRGEVVNTACAIRNLEEKPTTKIKPAAVCQPFTEE